MSFNLGADRSKPPRDFARVFEKGDPLEFQDALFNNSPLPPPRFNAGKLF